MGKDILTIFGIDGVVSMTVYLTDPSFLKIVLGIGLASMFALLYLSKGQGRVATYGANLCMGLVIAFHYT